MRFIAFVLLFLLACQGREAQHLSKKEQSRFRAVYIDLADFQGQSETPQKITADSLMAICQRHGLTHDDYQKAMVWYRADPTRWRKFYAEVLGTLDQRAAHRVKSAH